MNMFLRKIYMIAALAVGILAPTFMIAMDQDYDSVSLNKLREIHTQLSEKLAMQQGTVDASIKKFNADLLHLSLSKIEYTDNSDQLDERAKSWQANIQEVRTKQAALECDKKASKRSKGKCQSVREIQAEDKRLKKLNQLYTDEAFILRTEKNILDKEKQRINAESDRLAKQFIELYLEKKDLSADEKDILFAPALTAHIVKNIKKDGTNSAKTIIDDITNKYGASSLK